jgi:hypothetical protein
MLSGPGADVRHKDAGVVATKLLDTAREDTIAGYNIAIHGQGEACLSCALASLPASQK